MLPPLLAKISQWALWGMPPLLLADAITAEAFPYGTLGSAAILAWYLINDTRVVRPRQEKDRSDQAAAFAVHIKEQSERYEEIIDKQNEKHAALNKEQSDRYREVIDKQNTEHREERREDRGKMTDSIDRLCDTWKCQGGPQEPS